MEQRKKIGQILMEMGYVTPVEIKEALDRQKSNGTDKRLGEILIEMKCCKPEQVAKALAKQFNLPYVNLAKVKIAPDVIEAVPKETAVEHQIVPVKRDDRKMLIAMADPLDFFTLDNLRFILGTEVECVIASKEAVRMAIGEYYGELSALDEMIGEVTKAEITFKTDALKDLEVDGEEDAPVIKLVNNYVVEAIRKRASDLHFEPFEREVRVRFRIDGVCKVQDPVPKKLQGPIISRLKIMSKMDMAEKRKPQDGRIKMVVDGREIDFRVSSLPARHGESVVLRVLDREKALVDLEELGFHPSDYERFKKIIRRPNGIFLVTGPTGSGKTTTLYAALKKLNRPDVKIITAENPVEYNISGINQAQVNHKIGLDFSRILKTMLRQAPNVILVGEIRDKETADTAIQAALTGHLVFSTLHTNDAPSSISRLTDMGVKPFLVSSAILAIMAQRLVRKLCSACKEQYSPPKSLLRAVGITDLESVRTKTLYRAVGCSKCDHGYKGRIGLYELMEMNSQLRDMAFEGKPTDEVRKVAIQTGMVPLQQDGIRKVLTGITTIEEILCCTHRQDLALEEAPEEAGAEAEAEEPPKTTAKEA